MRKLKKYVVRITLNNDDFGEKKKKKNGLKAAEEMWAFRVRLIGC